MKTTALMILALLFVVSCESTQSSQANNDKEQEQKQQEKSEKKEKKTTRRKVKDDDRVSGYFELKIDGQTYKSTHLQDNYCDMTFLYKGDESFSSIRLKDDETYNTILLTFYGSEDFMLDPTGTIESFMFSDADNKVNLQFMPGDKNSKILSLTMVEGTFNVTNFSKGEIEASFEGKVGKPADVVTKENLLPIEGEIKLKTVHVKEMGKNKES